MEARCVLYDPISHEMHVVQQFNMAMMMMLMVMLMMMMLMMMLMMMMMMIRLVLPWG